MEQKTKTIRIFCADKTCSSRDREDPIEVTEILLSIGLENSYRCPYCRGKDFEVWK